MTSNHEEYSNYIIFKNLKKCKCKNLKIQNEIVRIFAEKLTKELQVIKLDFSIFSCHS